MLELLLKARDLTSGDRRALLRERARIAARMRNAPEIARLIGAWGDLSADYNQFVEEWIKGLIGPGRLRQWNDTWDEMRRARERPSRLSPETITRNRGVFRLPTNPRTLMDQEPA